MRSDLNEKSGTETILLLYMPRTQIVSPAPITVRELQAKPFYMTHFLLCMKQYRVEKYLFKSHAKWVPGFSMCRESNAHHLNNHCI